MTRDYICHHGIKGQKHGIRRFQYKDGSLTPAGRQRYLKGGGEAVKNAVDSVKSKFSRKSKGSSSGESKPTTTATLKTPEVDKETRKKQILDSRSPSELYKNADLFTTQELQSAYNRLVLERNIQNLSPKQVSKGQQMIDKYVKTATNIGNILQSTNKVLGQVNSSMKILNNLTGGSKKKNDSDKSDSDSSKKDDEKDDKKSGGKTTVKETVENVKKAKDFADTFKEAVVEGNSDKKKKKSRPWYSDDSFDRAVNYVTNTIEALPEGYLAGMLPSGDDDDR